jgi:Ca-activated chloride channel homolog
MLRLILSAFLLSQAPAQEPQRFTSRSDLVVLHVTVVDRKAGYVAGLPREAFAVYEDGKPQSVSFFESADSPVTAGLVIDSSVSMQRRRESVIAAGIAFAESSRPDDEMFTVHFNEKVWSGLPEGQMFTSDREELRHSLLRSTARGQTALFDALRLALTTLEQGHRQKKILLVVSDGGDNASRTTFDDALAMALRMDAVIYTVSVHDQYDDEAKPDVLRKLASATGGESFFLRNAAGVTETFERIARDIRSGYTLGYVPTSNQPGYRSLRVDVRPPNGRKPTVRARSGYTAEGGSERP